MWHYFISFQAKIWMNLYVFAKLFPAIADFSNVTRNYCCTTKSRNKSFVNANSGVKNVMFSQYRFSHSRRMFEKKFIVVITCGRRKKRITEKEEEKQQHQQTKHSSKIYSQSWRSVSKKFKNEQGKKFAIHVRNKNKCLGFSGGERKWVELFFVAFCWAQSKLRCSVRAQESLRLKNVCVRGKLKHDCELQIVRMFTPNCCHCLVCIEVAASLLSVSP